MRFPLLRRSRHSAAAALLMTLTSVSTAIASQGPGAGPGAASPLMQLVMAIVVYGTTALLLAAALIGSLRRRS
jgi:hypothetical protein